MSFHGQALHLLCLESSYRFLKQRWVVKVTPGAGKMTWK